MEVTVETKMCTTCKVAKPLSECEVHDGTRATVAGEITDNTSVLIRVRLVADGRIVLKYDHEVFRPERTTCPVCGAAPWGCIRGCTAKPPFGAAP